MTPSDFPLMNWIDLPEDIAALEPVKDSVEATTQRGIYRIDGCFPPFHFEGRRFYAMTMVQDDKARLPSVTLQKYI